MAPKRADQKEVRVLLPQEVHSLLKRLSGVQEKSMNGILNEAVDRFLESDDIQELIKKHKLEDFE